MAVSVTPLTPPSVVEKEIEARILKVWADAGYTTADGVPANNLMHEAAFEAVRTHIANTKEDIANNALTKGELFAAVFPDAPGADGSGEPVDEFDQEVAKRLERDVWSLTQPKDTGYIQKRLGEEGSKLILCRETIRRKVDRAWGVYLTESPVIIMEKVVEHEAKAYEQKAASLRQQLDMVRARQKDLHGQINARVRQAEKKTKAELSFSVPATPEALLPEGSEDEE
jgi:hypothetical protein